MVKFQGVPNYNYNGTPFIYQKKIYINKKNLLVDSWGIVGFVAQHGWML